MLLLAATSAPLSESMLADTFGTGSDAFTIDFVHIGNPGNPADTTGDPNPVGAVPYTYRMGTYEVSRDMITKANSAGGLGITMDDMTIYGGNGAARPATGVSWFEAAAFVNWLNTSTGHKPAYHFDQNGDFTLWSVGEAWTKGGQNLYRNKDAYYFLPSDDEWYKAAYYDGTGYFVFPTGSDSPPGAVAGGTGAGTAVYSQGINQGPTDITNAGGLSPYGTMGQGGNVWEWQENAFTGGNDLPMAERGFRGGGWYGVAVVLNSSERGYYDPWVGVDAVGFRVAAVPEPLKSATLAGLGCLVFGVWLRRRRK